MFILSSESKDVLIEKHWGQVNERSVCDFFWAEVGKLSSVHELPSVLTSPQHYIFHYKNDGVILICVSQEEMPPLLAVEFMARCCDIFTEYFGDTKERTLRAHFVTVYQLLEEMCDSGMPLLTESGILKEIIAPPNLINRMASAIQGTKGVVVSNTLPDGMSSNIPWRRGGVKYTSNEIFFDVIEEVDATVDSQGRMVMAAVIGQINCNCRLSGMPDVTLTFTNPNVMEDARLHPSVRFARFAGDRALSFVPPDGNFTLMHYKVKAPAVGPGMGRARGGAPSLPIYVKPQVGFSHGTGRVSIMVGPKTDLGKPVEGIVITMPLPKFVVHADLSANWGSVTLDISKKFCRWEVGKLPKDKTPILSGTLRLERNDGTASADHSKRLDPAPIISVDFKVTGVTISGLSVDSLSISNESYKPYKGVRCIAKAGLFEVRT